MAERRRRARAELAEAMLSVRGRLALIAAVAFAGTDVVAPFDAATTAMGAEFRERSHKDGLAAALK